VDENILIIYLLEFDRGAVKNTTESVWAGLISNNILYGNNHTDLIYIEIMFF
jgi:hypothetical protein